MKVLLTKDIKDLGKAGEVVDVKDGYGQNFIIKGKRGVLATTEVLRKHASEQKKKAENEAYELSELKKLAEVLSTKKVFLKKKVGENGALFGSITKDDIAKAFKDEHNLEVDKKGIVIDFPIKTTGIYDLSAKLGSGVVANLHIEVVSE